MVVLVRCCDNSCTLALESRLKDLINEGLVVEVLRNDTWVKVVRPMTYFDAAQAAPRHGRAAALASSF